MSRIHLRLALFSSSCFFRFQKRRRRREKHQQRTFCSTGGRSFFFLPAFSFPLSFVVLTRTGESYFTKDISGGIIVALWFQLLSSSSFPFILQTQFQVPARLSKHLRALPLSVSLMRCVRPKKAVRSVGCVNKKDKSEGSWSCLGHKQSLLGRQPHSDDKNRQMFCFFGCAGTACKKNTKFSHFSFQTGMSEIFRFQRKHSTLITKNSLQSVTCSCTLHTRKLSVCNKTVT